MSDPKELLRHFRTPFIIEVKYFDALRWFVVRDADNKIVIGSPYKEIIKEMFPNE